MAENTGQRTSTDEILARQAVAWETSQRMNLSTLDSLKHRFTKPVCNFVVLGALGDLYTGWLKLHTNLEALAEPDGSNIYLFDTNPRFQSSGVLTDYKGKALLGKRLSSPAQMPDNAIVVVLTPSALHEPEVEALLKNPRVKGIYCEKPCAVNPTQLQRLQSVLATAGKPVYLADDYYFLGLPLLALMGKAMPYKNFLDVTASPDLKRSITANRRVMGDIVDIRSVLSAEGGPYTETRPWLRKASTGGGVLLDLQIHINDLLTLAGIPLEPPDTVMLKTKQGNAPGLYRKIQKGRDEAEWVAHMTGRLTHPGGKYDFYLAQDNTPEQTTAFLEIQDIAGKRVRFSYLDGTTQIFDPQGRLSGTIRLKPSGSGVETTAEAKGNPYYFLKLDHAFRYLNSGETTPLFYEPQAESLQWIFAAKAHYAANLPHLSDSAQR